MYASCLLFQQLDVTVRSDDDDSETKIIRIDGMESIFMNRHLAQMSPSV